MLWLTSLARPTPRHLDAAAYCLPPPPFPFFHKHYDCT
jgi:hypothetical protein